MIIYGWLGRPTILGTKNDLCATCGVAGPHAIVRIVRWVTLFWAPIVPIWISHKLISGNCGAQTKLGWRQVRAGLRSGTLPLPHRAGFDAYAQQMHDETYRRPAESEFDVVTKNPGRDAWDLYLKAWLILVAVLVLAVVFLPRSSPVPANQPTPTHVVIDHTCWIAANGALAGCRMADGTVVGVPEGRETTCYFLEPMPTGDVTLRCDN